MVNIFEVINLYFDCSDCGIINDILENWQTVVSIEDYQFSLRRQRSHGYIALISCFQDMYSHTISLVKPFLGLVIAMKISNNPDRAVLAWQDLKDTFGEGSRFQSKLQKHDLDENAGAVLQMENPAGRWM